jgi:hypothetical protein
VYAPIRLAEVQVYPYAAFRCPVTFNPELIRTPSSPRCWTDANPASLFVQRLRRHRGTSPDTLAEQSFREPGHKRGPHLLVFTATQITSSGLYTFLKPANSDYPLICIAGALSQTRSRLILSAETENYEGLNVWKPTCYILCQRSVLCGSDRS